MKQKIITRLSLLFIILFWCSAVSYSGAATEGDCPKYYSQELKKYVYTRAETEPEFAGGQAAYQRFIHHNLRLPQETIENHETEWASMSRVKFIVDSDGQIINPVVHEKKDTTQLNAFEKEVLRVVRLMPKWNPGTCQGKRVAVEVNRPLVMCILLEKE